MPANLARLEETMDRNDGQDIRHYDSTEAIAASQQMGDDATTDMRGIEEDETSDRGLVAGRGDVATAGPDDSSPVDEEETADIYDEPAANLDFDPESDPLGMGTDEDDDMITGE
jgi:hypothetical protein